MEESKPVEQTGVEVIAKFDALTVGIAVLQAVRNLRRGEEWEVDVRDQGVTIRIASHPASNRVIVIEV